MAPPKNAVLLYSSVSLIVPPSLTIHVMVYGFCFHVAVSVIAPVQLSFASVKAFHAVLSPFTSQPRKVYPAFVGLEITVSVS